MNKKLICVHKWLAVGVPLAILSLFIPACGGPRRAGPVDLNKAHAALATVLTNWKQGIDYADLDRKLPEITVQDFDWQSGLQLIDFETLGNDRRDDANLHCPVRLKLRDSAGNEMEKRVTYVIGTSPVITVFREMMM